jgi:hypothetical protein
MKKLPLCVFLLAIICQLGMAQENSPWYVKFYQDPNAGGAWTKLDVNPDGSAIPIDQFEKYGLQDEISEIRYKLPTGVLLECFTGRFFKTTDGDIANFINNSQFLKDLAGKAGVQFGEGVLTLAGDGTDKVLKLWEIAGGRYDNRIRSAKLVKP